MSSALAGSAALMWINDRRLPRCEDYSDSGRLRMRPDRVVRKKSRRGRPRPAMPPPERQEPPALPPSPDYEVDVAPELVERGPDERRDRQPICSVPHEDV
jgi:hypothetical protein